MTAHRSAEEEPRLYNSRVINNYVRYLEKHHPEVDREDLIFHAGMEPWQVADQGHWFSQRQINLFHERMGEVTGNRNIPREVGRYLISSEGMGAFRQYTLSFLSLGQIYLMIGKVASKITRASVYECRQLGRNQVEITVTPQPGVAEGPFQCQNRLGSFESPALFFTGEYPTIEHRECLFSGGSVCRYVISWNDGPWLASRRMRALGYTAIAGGGLLALVGLSGPAFWLASGLLPAAALLLNTLGAHQELRRLRGHLGVQHDANARLLDQIDTTYKNAQLTSELGQVVSFGTHLNLALENILTVLAEHLDFSRGMVFLTDFEQERLLFRSGYGWSPAEFSSLRQTSFSLADLNADGALGDCFLRQRAVLVASKGQLEAFFSVLSPGLLRGLDLQSLIAAPIVVNQMVIGLLIVDRLKSPRPLLQSDVSQLMGIAPVIGMNIHNLQLVTEMEGQRQSLAAEVEHRTGELREALGAAHELAQRAEAANLAKSQFLANMSHEIRTPLIGVLGMNEILLQSGLNEQQQKLAATVQTSAETLLELLNDILDFSKIEAGKLTLEQVCFPLLATVEQAVVPLAENALSKGLDLVLQLAALSELMVTGDPRRLRQVLLNLVGNAIKFTPRGEVVVRADLLHLGAGTVTVRFSVRDTGIGIEPAAEQRIFDSFSQADPSTSREYGGSGLGLAIVRQLVTLMGGSLGLQSQLGVGSCFWFTLPLTAVASERVLNRSSQLAGRVLLWTGSSALAEGLRDHLALRGLILARVQDRSSALARLAATEEGPWSLVLIDLSLDPTEAGSALTDFCSGLLEAGMRVVLIGSGTECSAQRSLFGGRVEYLCKPVLQEPLAALLDRPPRPGTSSEAGGSSADNSPALAAGVVGRRILLVEDNPTTRTLVQAMLARLDCPLTMVDSGEKALALWTPGGFDLVLMDCQMPGIDGFETTLRLRAAGCRAPILALTARAQKDDPELCRQAGMDDYLLKPFKQKELLAMVGRWLPTVASAFRSGEGKGGDHGLLL